MSQVIIIIIIINTEFGGAETVDDTFKRVWMTASCTTLVI